MIVLIKNRFTRLDWPNLIFVEPIAIDVECSFLIYCGADIELLYHPDTLTAFRANEPCGVVVESESIHTFDPDFPGLIGMPKFRDDFFVLKSGEYAKAFLARWHQTKNVTAVVHELGVMPCEYPPQVIKVHCPLDDMPAITWGTDE